MRYAPLWLLLLARCCAFGATTYYVDFDGGSDAAAGTSTSVPWRTIPGTRTTNDSGFLNSAWGSVTTSARIADNTTIKLKSGTTMSSADGGYVWIGLASGHFYDGGFTNLVIERDTTWGSGDVVIDGTGMTIGVGLLLVQIDGVTFRGLTIQSSDVSGIQFKERAGGSDPLTNCTVLDCYIYNNGKSYATDTAGAGDGQINIRQAWTVLISNCVFNGNQRFTQGIISGDNAKGMRGNNLVVSCLATNHKGDLVTDDSGIGFKPLNSDCTFSNCVSAWNLKGFDCGEVNGTWGFTNKIISCTASNNWWGMNANGSASASYPGSIGFYFINNHIVSNAFKGLHIYAPPYTAAVVHNFFDNNGQQGSPYNGSQLSVTPEDTGDTNVAVCYSYNNIFQNSYVNVLQNNISHPTNRFTWLSDYNSYKQLGSERFCLWSLSYGPAQVEFQFGANGPGHASGNWYNWYAESTVAPLYGTGHFHSDSQSKGTGCDDTSLPSLSGYTLTAAFPMRNLSLESWYISEMGRDRDGQPRTSWDVGPNELQTVIGTVPVAIGFGRFKSMNKGAF